MERCFLGNGRWWFGSLFPVRSPSWARGRPRRGELSRAARPDGSPGPGARPAGGAQAMAVSRQAQVAAMLAGQIGGQVGV